MRAMELLERQFGSVHSILHAVADDLTQDEMTTRTLADTNLLAFDFWHVSRVQDWVLQTLVRGVPELIDEPRWQGRGRLATHGIGVGMTLDEADELAHSLALADVLAYADAAHANVISWLQAHTDEELERQPDVPEYLKRYPVYLEAAMREEVPWMFERPQVWRCLAPALGHNRDHLAEMDLLKRQARTRRS